MNSVDVIPPSLAAFVTSALEAAVAAESDEAKTLVLKFIETGGNVLDARREVVRKILASTSWLPLNALYLLNLHGLICFPSLLERLSKEKRSTDSGEWVVVTQYYAVNLLDMLTKHDRPSKLRSLKCFRMLILCSFVSEDRLGSPSVGLALFDAFLGEYLGTKSPTVDIFNLVNFYSNLDQKTLQKCYAHSIVFIVTHKHSGINSGMLDCSDFLSSTEKWKNFADNKTTGVSVEFLLPFQVEEFRSMLPRLLMRGAELNYRNFLAMVLLFLQHMQGAEEVINGLCNELIVQSLNNQDETSFVQALLLVRLACLEKGPLFPSYSEWFQRSFGQESTSLAVDRKSVQQLLLFLTKLVPFEPMVTLKSHLSRPPHVPMVCKQDWIDYAGLARTRLVDLTQKKVAIECASESTEHATETTKEVEEDVLSSLRDFKATGKICQKVLKIATFRKPYFLSQFVPCLLSLKTTSDVDQSVKDQFVQELVKRGKIPESKVKGSV